MREKTRNGGICQIRSQAAENEGRLMASVNIRVRLRVVEDEDVEQREHAADAGLRAALPDQLVTMMSR